MAVKSMDQKHTFALFVEALCQQEHAALPDSTITLTDRDAWHRIYNVLHLEPNQTVILFNKKIILHVALDVSVKKGVVAGTVTDVFSPQAPTPTINVYQGLLRKEAFGDVTYSAAQMGATNFIPLLTTKSQRSWGDLREEERIESVMIAACEQAKQFVLPTVHKPKTIQELFSEPKVWNDQTTFSLYCEPEGKPFGHALQHVWQNKPSEINIFIGPEGGFSADEETLLKNASVFCYALTPTILRSQDALAVCLGAIRSVSA